MNVNGCRVLLTHDAAQSFFDEAMHPDMESLERRDAFFAALHEELSCRMDGTDLIEDIPDIELSSLPNVDTYSSVKNFIVSFSLRDESLKDCEAVQLSYHVLAGARVSAA